MKKALVIFLALAMVCSVFAADPVAEVKVADFKGEAAVTFGVNLDTERSGFKNEEKAELKLNLLGEGNKSTAGDGLWGELVIKTKGENAIKVDDAGKPENFYIKAEVEKALIHFGDVYMGIRKGDLSYGGDFWFPNALNWKDDKDDFSHYPSSDFKVATPKTTYNQGFLLGYDAKIFKIEASLRTNPYLDTKEDEYWTNKYAMGVYGEVKPITDLRVGVGAAYVLGDMSEEKKLSKDINDADHKNDFAMFAGAEYAFDITDSFRLQPVVTYNMYNDYVWEDAKKGKYITEGGNTASLLGLGLRFGFKQQKSKDGDSLLKDFFGKEMAYNTKKEEDKTLLPGVSVYTQLDLTKDAMKKNLPLLVTFYPGELVKGLNAAAFAHVNLGPDAPKVSTNYYKGKIEHSNPVAKAAIEAALNGAAPVAGKAAYEGIITGRGVQVGLAAGYDVVLGDITIVPAAGMLFTYGSLQGKYNSKVVANQLRTEVKVDVKGLIKNTTLTAFWDTAAFGNAKSNEFKYKVLGTELKMDADTYYETKKGLVGIKAKIAL